VSSIIGIDERWYPKPYDLVDRIPVTVVLVEGNVHDYTAHVGAGNKADAERIARHGDKISFEEACCHFPGGQIERDKYRY